MSVDAIRRSMEVVPVLTVLALAGCSSLRMGDRAETPTAAGLNTNNLIDPAAQLRADREGTGADVYRAAEQIRREEKPATLGPRHSVLCLSGGGAFGAYSAGVLCGWTCRGDRPQFDVVTGISTGALIAPLAFLGRAYDPQVKEIFTQSENRDVYRLQPIRGFFGESLANNAPLARAIDDLLTPQLLQAIAAEHAKGRRLYVGTTETEGRRFVIWDLGEIACRGTPRDRELFKQVLLGSSAIPAFFPPARIPVTVNGQTFVEKHVDGGVSQSLFFRPPYVPSEHAGDPTARSLNNVDVYVIVAGKLYADPEVVKPRWRRLAANDVSAILYAQTRGDLQRLWTTCTLTGMNFHLAALRLEYPAPKSSTDFNPEAMQGMFHEGVKQVLSGDAWRKTPPGVNPGEEPLIRSDTNLTYTPRSPDPRSGIAVPAMAGPQPLPLPLPTPGSTQ